MPVATPTPARVPALLALLLGAAFVLLYLYVAAWRGQFGGAVFALVFIPVAILLGIAALAAGGAGSLVSSDREHGLRWPQSAGFLSSASFALAGLALVSIPVITSLEDAALARAAQESTPLCEAILAYERARGFPPASLAELVPEGIAEVPSTTLRSSPAFLYDSSVERGSLAPTWSLRVECRKGVFRWGQLLYYPDGDYTGTEIRWAGEHEIRNGWAYVYE